MKYVVDTHPLIWFFTGDARLGTQARTILTDPQSQLVLPATTLAEAYWIGEQGRVARVTPATIFAALSADPRFVFVSLDRQIIEISKSLTLIGEIHDRQIVATALHLQNQGEQVALLTRDQNITQSGYVPVLW